MPLHANLILDTLLPFTVRSVNRKKVVCRTRCRRAYDDDIKPWIELSMAPPPPSSPSSLLWAHQLKREHGYLQKRLDDIQTTSDKQDRRIKTLESGAYKSNELANAEVTTLAKHVKALQEQGLDTRLSDMETNVNQKLDDVQAESEAMTLQIAALQ